jgi:hypothetical protein
MNTRTVCSSCDSPQCILVRKAKLQEHSVEVDSVFYDFNQRKENTVNYIRLSDVRSFNVDGLPGR